MELREDLVEEPVEGQLPQRPAPNLHKLIQHLLLGGRIMEILVDLMLEILEEVVVVVEPVQQVVLVVQEMLVELEYNSLHLLDH
jgi:hypothetical protein